MIAGIAAPHCHKKLQKSMESVIFGQNLDDRASPGLETCTWTYQNFSGAFASKFPSLPQTENISISNCIKYAGSVHHKKQLDNEKVKFLQQLEENSKLHLLIHVNLKLFRVASDSMWADFYVKKTWDGLSRKFQRMWRLCALLSALFLFSSPAAPTVCNIT